MSTPAPSNLDPFLGHSVVVETDGYFIFAGNLAAIGPLWLTLDECDMHDHRESNSTREVYILDIAKHGIRKNRDRVLVSREKIVAVSLTEEVTKY